MLFAVIAHADLVRLYFPSNTNASTMLTNAVVSVPISGNILSSGGVIPTGIPTRLNMGSTGVITNYFSPGYYALTNTLLGSSGIVLRSLTTDNTTVVDYTNRLWSGYNKFVTVTNGSGNPEAITNHDTRVLYFDGGGGQIRRGDSGVGSLALGNADKTNHITWDYEGISFEIGAYGSKKFLVYSNGVNVSGTNLATAFAGDGTYVSNVVASYVSGTLTNSITGNAATATTATNLYGTFNPWQFGGVGSTNGTITTDDTAALSNAIVALNVRGGVLSLGNHLWYVSQQLPPITASQVVVENGAILTSNKTIYLLGVDQGNHSAGVRRNFHFQNLTLGRMGYGDAPNATSVGLRLGTNNLYGLNAVVQNCMITNFWRGVEVTGISQTWLDHNFIAGNWSNNIYVGDSIYNPDGFKVTYNDINNNDILPQPDAVLTNAILVQFEQGCLNAFFEGNNAGGGKQAFFSSQSGNFKFLNNQWELFRSANSSNMAVFHFTNSTVQMDGEGGLNGIYYANPYGSSNYAAMVGLYGFCNFNACYFKSPGISGGYSFDIWQREAGSQPGNTTLPFMDSAYFVRTHTTYGDVGTTESNSKGNIPKTTDPYTYWWSSNVLYLDGEIKFNAGSDIAYMFGADVNAKGTYSGNNLLWRSGHRLGNGTIGTFITSQAFDTSVYDVNLGGDPAVQRTSPMRWRIYTSPDISTVGTERWRFANSSLLPVLGTNSIGSSTQPVGDIYATNYFVSTAKILSGAGTPESAVTAPVGSLYLRNDGGAATTLYIKESTTGSTGWVGAGSGGGGGSGDSISVSGVGAADANFIDSAQIDFSLNTTPSPDEISALIVAGSLTATELGADSVSASELNATGVESDLEAVMDLQDLQGAVTDAQVPNTITVDLATTATTANAGDSATAFFSSGAVEAARLDSTVILSTEIDDASEQDALGMVNKSGAQAITGDKVFTRLRRLQTDLNSGTALTVGQDYYDQLAANRTLTFSGTAADGDIIGLVLDVSVVSTVTFPTSEIYGGEGATVTTVLLWVGTHNLMWKRTGDGAGGSVWVFYGPGVRNKLDATAAPGTGDDAGDGYSIGSVWINTTGDTVYTCADATAAAAVWVQSGGGSGAPTTADYLVGTANGSLSAEIVVGTSPGGELGGTWASPTLDDSVSVSSWVLTSPTITTGITPTVNAGAALGTTSLMFSGLFLSIGSTINFNNGDLTFAHTSDLLTFSGGTFALGNGATSGGVLRLTEDTDTGANYVEMVPGNPTGNRTLTAPDATGTLVLEDNTATLTGKTFDAAGAGNFLKKKDYLTLKGFDRVVGALPINTNDYTTITYMAPRFLNGTDKAANYIEWRFVVPEDYDNTVTPRAKLAIRLTAADTAAHRYVLSYASVAASAAAAGTPSTEVNLDLSADASGASGDVEFVGYTSLTSWSPTAGQLLLLRLARDGDTSDASTVDSDFISLTLEYGVSQ